MQRQSPKHMTRLFILRRRTLLTATKLALTVLCGLLLTSGALAQEQQPEPPPMPEQSTPEAAAPTKAPNPNELTTPAPLANQTVDGDIVFTSPGQFTYLRDIHLSDNFGGLRFHGTNGLTTSPAGAAIQFFGNNATPYPGQLYLDSGAHNSAALIFRTAPAGGTITERMRVRADGRVFIGTTSQFLFARLNVEADTNNSSVAVDASSSSSSGFGVSGSATGSSGSGVLGRAIGSDGVGVFGDATGSNGVGVRGRVSAGGAAAVRGEATSGGAFAGQFFGPVQVNGTLTKAAGSFKIDHPLDPENKYLSHSFVESPDMMNIYNGNVVLDRRGRATVTLPDWFEALNREFRYQLTAVGAPGPNLYVLSEIKGNTFKVAGGKPGMKVSWMVTGVRHDAYAKAHRIPVEEEKRGEERGTYLNPEAFGQPAEKRVGHAQQPTSSQQTTTASVGRKE